MAFSKPEPEDIIVYAERGYENMMTALKLDNQGNTLADPKKRGNKDDYLMAALYVPGVGVFLCSIPQPAAKKYITANAPVDVPALWGEIKGRTPSGSAHAEDGSAFRYEKSLKKKLAAGAKYPAGSIIRVWGSFKGGKAKQQSLCSTGTSKIDPACDPVFVNLGVGH